MNEVLAAAESDVQRVRRQAEEEQAKLQSSASAATAAKLAEEQAKFEELQRKYALEVKTMKSELEDKDAEVVAARAEDEVHHEGRECYGRCTYILVQVAYIHTYIHAGAQQGAESHDRRSRQHERGVPSLGWSPA